VDANITTTRRTLRKLEGDLLRTTTLTVLHDCTARFARCRLLASSSIRHGVVKLNVGILRDRYLVLVDREVLAGATVEAWSISGRQRALNAFALETPLGQGITLAKAVGASPTTEVEAAIGGEATSAEVAPAPARLLLRVALVVVVLWSHE
jgi:DNA-binding transcriptional regulator YdaS (Cro superfamily)